MLNKINLRNIKQWNYLLTELLCRQIHAIEIEESARGLHASKRFEFRKILGFFLKKLIILIGIQMIIVSSLLIRS